MLEAVVFAITFVVAFVVAQIVSAGIMLAIMTSDKFIKMYYKKMLKLMGTISEVEDSYEEKL